MNNLKPVKTEQSLRVRDKIFTGLGMTMVAVATIIWLLTEVLIPDFTKPSWDLASPGLTLLTFIIGSYLVLRGMKTLISSTVSRLDNTLKQFVVYRITRWIAMKVVLIVLLILEFIFSAIGDNTPDENNAKSSPIPSSNPRDGAWDVASNHYYDKELPPPFS